MKIIKPSTEFYGAVPTDYESALRFIEKAGRTCYKSEGKITEDSAEKFVKKLIKAGHLAMVEHSNMVVKTEGEDEWIDHELFVCTVETAGKYLRVWAEGHDIYVGGNLTAWYQRGMETGWPEMFWAFWGKYGQLFDMRAREQKRRKPFRFSLCPHDEIPQELHRYAVKFICDRGVSHELVRHRPCSFAQESTRYVNYGGKDMEFIEPAGFGGWSELAQLWFENMCEGAEADYDSLLTQNLKPQQARAVLPNALKTEVIVTADLQEWNHIFKLRCAPGAHPDFVRLAVPLRDKFIDEGLMI